MNIIKLALNTKPELCKVYIQQFKYGGVFIPGNLNYNLDDEVFLLINLPDAEGSLALNGTVQWVSPESAVNYAAGIGVQFKNDRAGQDAKSRIEVMLGGMLQQQNNLSYTF